MTWVYTITFAISIYLVGALVTTYITYRVPYFHDKMQYGMEWPPHFVVIVCWPVFWPIGIPAFLLSRAFGFIRELASANREKARQS